MPNMLQKIGCFIQAITFAILSFIFEPLSCWQKISAMFIPIMKHGRYRASVSDFTDLYNQLLECGELEVEDTCKGISYSIQVEDTKLTDVIDTGMYIFIELSSKKGRSKYYLTLESTIGDVNGGAA